MAKRKDRGTTGGKRVFKRVVEEGKKHNQFIEWDKAQTSKSKYYFFHSDLNG